MVGRRSFLKGTALVATAGMLKRGGAMLPSEQAAHDMFHAFNVPPAAGLLAGEPALFNPAPTSMDVTIAVTALAAGRVEVADNPEMKDPVSFMAEGFPLSGIDDRVLCMRITGLKPGTRYWYRAGAASIAHPVGYWTKTSETEWSGVHSFLTPGENAPSRFAVMNDTHAKYDRLAKTTRKYRELGAPLVVWNGDVAGSMTMKREGFVQDFVLPPENPGYAADTPIALNMGNHDYRGDAFKRIVEVVPKRRPEERTMDQLALGRNFAFRQGEIALIGLDTGEDKPDFHPAAGGLSRFSEYRKLQAKWLEDQFKRPEIANAPYVVAFAHIPLYDSDPKANPGTILEDYAMWQKECAELWNPILTANRVQLVMAAHTHAYRFDPAGGGRSWAQIVGGGPGKRECNYFTLVDCAVENGELVATVHDTDADKVVGVHRFKPRA